MRPRFVLLLGLGLQGAVACLVPTFDVDSATSTSGGASAGTSTSGAPNGNGGTRSNGGTSGAPSSAAGETSNAGGEISNAGGETSGEAGAAGAAGAPSGSGGGPVRVGFSVFHDSAAGNDEASSKLTDATFTKPAGTEPGDFMFVFFGCDHSLRNLTGSHLAITGWTLQDQHEEYGVDGQGTYLLYKFADGTEPDSIVFAGINEAGSGNGVQGLLSVYRGVSKTAPINAYEVLVKETGSDDVTHIVTETPAITTTADDCLLISGLSPDTAIDAPRVSSWPEGFDENHVSVLNPPTPYPFGWANIYSAERHAGKAGSVSGSAFEWDMTYDGSQYYGSLAFVIALSPRE